MPDMAAATKKVMADSLGNLLLGNIAQAASARMPCAKQPLF
jgi:hypothetical protein